MVAEDNPGTDYYSVGAKKNYFNVGDLLREGNDIITDG